MSEKVKKQVLGYMRDIKRDTEKMIECLLEEPLCLDEEPKKEEVYLMVLDYFKRKQEKSKYEGQSYAKACERKILTWVNSYNQSEESKKDGYAIKVALEILNTKKFWLRRIPDQVKDEAFQIIYMYLEKQMRS